MSSVIKYSFDFVIHMYGLVSGQAGVCRPHAVGLVCPSFVEKNVHPHVAGDKKKLSLTPWVIAESSGRVLMIVISMMRKQFIVEWNPDLSDFRSESGERYLPFCHHSFTVSVSRI